MVMQIAFLLLCALLRFGQSDVTHVSVVDREAHHPPRAPLDNIYLAPVSGSEGLPSVLLTLVPGGLVPIASYVPTIKAVQVALASAGASEGVRAYAVIIECLANLCDPLVDLNGRILAAIEVAQVSMQ
jgi:hypothetical protein